MKIKELAPILHFQETTIYKAIGKGEETDYNNLYIGQAHKIPSEILNLEIVCMGISFDHKTIAIQAR